MSPTVHREDGFQFRIYPNDHSPPHVHAVKAGGFAKVAIGSVGEPPCLLEARRLKDREIVRAVRIVERRWQKLMFAWTDIHGETNAQG